MVEPIFLGALLNKLTYIYNIITKMVYEISMNQNGNDIVKHIDVGHKRSLYYTHSNRHTDTQTDNGGGGKQIEKSALTSYPFGTSFAKHM